jgi:2,5-diamino-6-(ribosylamino)-4(3H)-pyrimidinone 5'-phosphate reductase
VSLDGATTGFEPDMARFYRLAGTWHEDVTLVGADTILGQEAALADAPRPGPATDGPLLAVVDGGRRVREWEALRTVGHWSDVVALRCESTPPPDGSLVEEIVAGTTRVDLAGALRALGSRPGIEVVRVDSGGALTGALLAAGLVDEVSLLVHPCAVGTAHGRRWQGEAVIPSGHLSLIGNETLDGLAWLRYDVRQPGGAGSAPGSGSSAMTRRPRS